MRTLVCLALSFGLAAACATPAAKTPFPASAEAADPDDEDPNLTPEEVEEAIANPVADPAADAPKDEDNAFTGPAPEPGEEAPEPTSPPEPKPAPPSVDGLSVVADRLKITGAGGFEGNELDRGLKNAERELLTCFAEAIEDGDATDSGEVLFRFTISPDTDVTSAEGNSPDLPTNTVRCLNRVLRRQTFSPGPRGGEVDIEGRWRFSRAKG